MRARPGLIALPIVVASVVCAYAADWPGYLGLNRNGTSAEKGILRAWPSEGPRVLWSAPIGGGFGGPVVAGGKVYLLDRDDAVGDKLRVFDFATGKELWSFASGAPGRFDHPGSRTTPAVDGSNVYTFGPTGDLFCLNTETHKPVWTKNVYKDFGGSSLPRWALTQNPLIYQNFVIVAAQAPQATVVAYDKLTGDLKWKSPVLAGSAGYVSPAVVKVAGADQLVMIMAAQGFGRSASGGGASGLDPMSGQLLWSYTNWQCVIPVPHAVDAGDGRILLTGGYSAGAAMIKVQKGADGKFTVTELFKNPDFGSHTQPPILYKDHFYVPYTINERSDGLVCMTVTGQVKWKTGESPSFNKGGLVLVDGVLLASDGNTKVYVIDPDPAGFKPLASATLLEPGENWAPLALADGRLLIRDQKHMKCVQVAQQIR
jgi:outer membrane protein assembly factor BamB